MSHLFDDTPAAPKKRTKKTAEAFAAAITAKAARQVRLRERKADKGPKRKYVPLEDVPPPSAMETNFRHAHWKARRHRVRQVLQSTGASQYKLISWDYCGSDCAVEYSPSLKNHRLRANYCKDRHCEPCMKARAGRMAANLRDRLNVGAVHRFRFVTLTQVHTTEPLRQQIDRLYKNSKKLRNTRWWTSRVIGGVQVLEVKWSQKTRQWHPHLHIICDAEWMPIKELSAQWLKVTGDSSIVDVTLLDDGKKAAFYLTKYVCKGTNLEVWHDDQAAREWVCATKGVRVAGTFGKWRGFALMRINRTATDWVPVAKLDVVLNAAKRGEAWAEAIWLSLRPGFSYDEVSPSDPTTQ